MAGKKKKGKKEEKSAAQLQAEEDARLEDLARKKQELQDLQTENDALKTISHELGISLEKHVQCQTSIIKDLDEELNKADVHLQHWTAKKNDLIKQRDTTRREHLNKRETLKMNNSMYLNKVTQKFAKMQAENDALISKHKQNKEDLTEMLDQAQKDMIHERHEHQRIVSERENKYVIEKASLKRDMQDKIKATKFCLLDMTEDQLHTTTKRTIMENEQINIELQYQSMETEKVMRKVDTLAATQREIRFAYDLEVQSKEMILARMEEFQKEVQEQTKRLVQLQEKALAATSTASFNAIVKGPYSDTRTGPGGRTARTNIKHRNGGEEGDGYAYAQTQRDGPFSSASSSSSSSVPSLSLAFPTQRPSQSAEGYSHTYTHTHARGQTVYNTSGQGDRGGGAEADTDVFAGDSRAWQVEPVVVKKVGKFRQIEEHVEYLKEVIQEAQREGNLQQEEAFRIRSNTQRLLTLQSEACDLLEKHTLTIRTQIQRDKRKASQHDAATRERAALLDAAAGLTPQKEPMIWPAYRGVPGNLSDIRLEDAEMLLQLLHRKLNSIPNTEEDKLLRQQERAIFVDLQSLIQKTGTVNC